MLQKIHDKSDREPTSQYAQYNPDK